MTFILIVKNGKLNAETIAKMLRIRPEESVEVANSLIKRGMMIDAADRHYECLHPRFAITNRYRIRCQEDNIPFKKNSKIDNIGLLLERPYENARAK